MSRSSDPAAAPAPPKGVEVGARVRAQSGPFLGRIGEVQEIDGANVKVAFGGISATIPLSDIVAVSEENLRPKLSSSHKKFPK